MAVKWLKSSFLASDSATQVGEADAQRSFLQQAVLFLILSIPSIYILLNIPPLWRDEDAFNEIVSTFAPKGILHYLPGYSLGARLIIGAGSIAAGLATGHAMPPLSINATPLTDPERQGEHRRDGDRLDRRSPRGARSDGDRSARIAAR